jgi:tetratricopeptide (TPR) repeat protein
MAFLPLAIGESTPPSSSSRASTPSVERPATGQTLTWIERFAHPLPDDGPRPEGRSSGIDGLAWQEGQSAYKKGAWGEAHRFFEKIVNDHPESSLVPSAKAFLIELSLRGESAGHNRSEAIQEYKKLLRDHPQSSNARRAEWRIADLYFEQGWFQEAQAFYEQAMAHSVHLPFDGNRALLGLGQTFMATGKWQDAEHAFADLRKRSEHDHVLQVATVGLAHALFRQHRLAEAQPFYNLSYRRWPHLVKGNPVTLQRYAVTEAQLHHDVSARDLMLLFYNLYPRHGYAPRALLHVADNLRSAGRRPLAEFVYALIPSIYPQRQLDATVKLRLATLFTENNLSAANKILSPTVSAMLNNVPVLFQTDRSYRAMLEEIAIREADNPTGSEALFYLGQEYEKTNDFNRALRTYKDVTFRTANGGESWAMKSAERLSALLLPWIEAAIASRDDWTVVSLFHRHGAMTEQRYADSPVLLEIAESHRRLGFTSEAARMFQQVLKAQNNSALAEPALIGLGKLYLDQQDPEAARKVLERYRFQFPLGRDEGEVLHLLIDAMRQQRDLEGLLHLCRTWLLRHPVHRERPAMYLQLAKTLGELDKLSESVIAYEEGFKSGATRSPGTLLSYADTLSRLNRHEAAIAAYQSVLEKNPSAGQAEWAHLQTAKHWTALQQYDRATVALAEFDVAEDQTVNRVAASLKISLQTARQSQKARGL